MPSRRDYADEYRRRQERAQEEGYASDYERRMAGVRDDPEYREYARGHRGEEFLRDQAERERERAEEGGYEPGLHLVLEEGARDSDGHFTTLVLQSDDPDVPDRVISIRGMDTDELYDLFAELDAEGVAIEVNYMGEE